MEERRGTVKILTGKPTGKNLLGTPRSRWEEDIRIDLTGIGFNAGNCIDFVQDRVYWTALVYEALNLRVPQAMELVNTYNKKPTN